MDRESTIFEIANALGDAGVDNAHDVMATLATGGIDFADVNRTLEEEGIEKFATSCRLLGANRSSESSVMTARHLCR